MPVAPRAPVALLRADARRNRDAVLTAAREVFAQCGLDAPLDAIARRAGVGRATLYRRFPTRDDLVRAIFEDNLEHLERVAARAADDDDAYFTILAATAEMLAEDRGFVDLLAHRPPAEEIAQALTARFLAVAGDPLRRAQEAGLVRTDFALEDTLLVVDMIRGAARRPGAQRRAVSLLFAALSPEAAA